MTGHCNARLTGITKLDRIGKRARAHPETVFNNLGHVITEEILYAAYEQLEQRKAALIKWTKQLMEKHSPKTSTY